MVIKLDYAPGQTPIDPDEMGGLIPRHITTQAELNEYEQANILAGQRWAFGPRQRGKELLNEGFVRTLHKRMFDKTWRWAGTFRSTDKSIGIAWEQVSVKLRQLLDNTGYQVAEKAFEADEIAVRFHHSLVLIHPFPNGNGRHARMMADVLVKSLGAERFSWGANADLGPDGDTRRQYIDALRAADAGQFEGLFKFARS
ncbi:mobile mystery protein B [Polaromonas sp. YR568]|uniref:mobile mystery protein B n=1 Tax=Polaromonas sp. YR568 TaxID=1855301 RepID=UPI00398BDC7D